ncbi:hypothetical protein C7S10_14605 [Nocardioides currus]|uniref:Uncharacterized protein n=1 Tax=Nocardioides currus TaxID=2133958 RepID=A0A2R7YWC5_9ACTN|nr:hypothetical protein C7S10_14605 [Nocardioides currus]
MTLIDFLATLTVMDCVAASADWARDELAVAVVCTRSGAAPRVTAHATATVLRKVLSNPMWLSLDLDDGPDRLFSSGGVGVVARTR